jgi:protein TonB
MTTASQTFEFPPGSRLPVVGEAHPLRQRYRRILIRAAVIASLFHVLVFAGWLAQRYYKPERVREGGPTVVHIVDIGVPPSLSEEQATSAVNVATQAAPPSIGVPEPVPDFQAEATTIATSQELSEQLIPTDISSLGGGGDSIVVELTGDHLPSASEFVPYEDPPILIELPTPDYPELARNAEMEGVVLVRALVGKDGSVKDAFVTKEVPMLNEAAVDAVKRAKFKPALQQRRPVAVWVQVPINFKLH